MKTKKILLGTLAVLACGGMVFDGTKGVAGYDLKPAAAEKKDATSMATNLDPETDTASFTLVKTLTATEDSSLEDYGTGITALGIDGTAENKVTSTDYSYIVFLIDTKNGTASSSDKIGSAVYINDPNNQCVYSDGIIDDRGLVPPDYGYGSTDSYSNFWDVNLNPVNGKTSSGKRYVALSNGSDYSYIFNGTYQNKFFLITNYAVTSMTVKVYGFKTAGTQLKSGGTQNIYEDIDHPADFDTIKSSIHAYDLFGAECTVSVTDAEKAKYQPNKIGAYDVQITASDTYGQTATATLHIIVYDQTKPVISLATGKSLTFKIDHDTLKVTDLPSYFTITDNASSKGGTIGTPVYKWDGTVFSADKVFSKTDKGTHTIIVDVKDSSGNEATTSFTATVKDVDAPVLARRDGGDVAAAVKVGLSRTFDLTKANFLALYKATDAVDGDVSSSLTVVGDFIPTHTGAYTITIKGVDTSGNAATQAISVTVIADIPPVFILGTDLVLTHANQTLSTTQLATIVTNGILMNKTIVNINSLNTGNYVGNESTVGDYTISYDVDVATSGSAANATINSKKMAEVPTTNVQGSFTLRVLEAEKADTTDDSKTTESGWEKFKKGFVNFFTVTIPECWQRFCNGFKGIFTKWKWNCWITDAEWNARFPKEVKDSAADSAVSDSTSGDASAASSESTAN